MKKVDDQSKKGYKPEPKGHKNPLKKSNLKNQPSDNTRHILRKVFAQGLLLPSASNTFLA